MSRQGKVTWTVQRSGNDVLVSDGFTVHRPIWYPHSQGIGWDWPYKVPVKIRRKAEALLRHLRKEE